MQRCSCASEYYFCMVESLQATTAKVNVVLQAMLLNKPDAKAKSAFISIKKNIDRNIFVIRQYILKITIYVSLEIIALVSKRFDENRTHLVAILNRWSYVISEKAMSN